MASLPPGVPALSAGAAALFVVPVLQSTDSISSILGFGTPQWGLYDQNNQPVITADSVVALGVKRRYSLPTYPIEGGGFANYNKVAFPFGGMVAFSQGGSISDRTEFLDDCETVAASLDLFNLVMPEKTYLNVNCQTEDFDRRAARGLGLMTVDLHVEEIRQTATQTFTQTASPVAADQVNSGSVQTQPVTSQQQSAISEIFGG